MKDSRIIIKGKESIIDHLMSDTPDLTDCGDFGNVTVKRLTKRSICIMTDNPKKRDELADFLYDYNTDEYGDDVIVMR